ncbi:serine/threonine-protein kinase nekl-3 [Anaeramoeba ignava]|uniref:Serine/threonine-protein kinase nekl-3 n=1 Tax=Anaeramoeba ignava TaxID=1746090 RepID=A0A9Q0LFH3_ANAIG|nr:serine/threonine-protein kinase nekl-3 [Anaeramoeba ignava]
MNESIKEIINTKILKEDKAYSPIPYYNKIEKYFYMKINKNKMLPYIELNQSSIGKLKCYYEVEEDKQHKSYIIRFKNKYEGTLKDYISSPNFSYLQFIEFIKQLLLGIHYLHSKNLFFSDNLQTISLSSILISTKRNNAIFTQLFFKEENFVYIGDAIKETQGLVNQDMNKFLKIFQDTKLNELREILFPEEEYNKLKKQKKEYSLTPLRLLEFSFFHEYSPIPKSFELRIESILPRFKRICYGQNVYIYDDTYDKISKLIDLSYCSTETFITPNIDIIEVKQNKDITLYSLYSRYKKQVFSTRDIIQKDEIIQLKTTDKLDLNSINECYLFSGKRFDSCSVIEGILNEQLPEFKNFNIPNSKHFFENFPIAHEYSTVDIESGLHTIYIYRVCLGRFYRMNQNEKFDYEKMKNYNSIIIEVSNKEMKSRYTQYFVFEQFSYYPEYEIKYRLHNIR